MVSAADLRPYGATLPRWAAPLAFSAVFISAFWLVLIVKPWSHTPLLMVDDAFDLVGTAVAIFFALGFVGGRRQVARAGYSRQARWIGWLVGASIACYGLGSLVWDVCELALNQPPFPSVADIFYLAFYPFLLGGILILTGGPLSKAARTRVVFDGVMIMTAVVTVSWYFVLGPTMLQSGEALLAKAVGAAYPVADLILILCLLLLWSRSQNSSLRSALLFLSAGLALTVFADSVFAYQGLHGGAPSPSLLDPAWTAAVMLLGIGASLTHDVKWADIERISTDEGVQSEEVPPLAYGVAPYALLPVVAALVLYLVRSTEDGPVVQGVFMGSVLLVTMLVIRQVAALRENHDLYRRVARANGELQNANQRLHRLATTDPITDGMNHRAIQQVLEVEIDRQRRYGRPCAVLFLDVDFFKSVNDDHGHLVGDSILREFDALVAATIRGADSVGRWGGEEFLAVLPETDNDDAIAVAERIRQAVSGAEFGPERLRVTCSIGVAGFPDDGSTGDELVSAADHAMYSGKMLGRNQVCAADVALKTDALAITAIAGHG